MDDVQIIWDLEDDPDGNYWHIVIEGHGVTREEVEEVLLDRGNPTEVSRTSGNLITFGWTSAGQHIAVLWELACDDPKMAYPLTAYPVPPRGGGEP
jgi:YD repeat-containing protein